MAYLVPSESVSCCSCVSFILVRLTILSCCSQFVPFVLFRCFDCCVFDLFQRLSSVLFRFWYCLSIWLIICSSIKFLHATTYHCNNVLLPNVLDRVVGLGWPSFVTWTWFLDLSCSGWHWRLFSCPVVFFRLLKHSCSLVVITRIFAAVLRCCVSLLLIFCAAFFSAAILLCCCAV